jgi:hypothetical protein
MLWRKTLSKINAADRKHAAQIEFAASYRVQTCEVGLVNLISAPAIFIKIALETPFLSEFFTRVLVEPRRVYIWLCCFCSCCRSYFSPALLASPSRPSPN